VFFPVAAFIRCVALAWQATASLRETAFLAEICHGIIVAVLGFSEVDWRSAE
jgi:bifunctional ADP-heptose synthase (sugar kinase/adenylyltransferase)